MMKTLHASGLSLVLICLLTMPVLGFVLVTYDGRNGSKNILGITEINNETVDLVYQKDISFIFSDSAEQVYEGVLPDIYADPKYVVIVERMNEIPAGVGIKLIREENKLNLYVSNTNSPENLDKEINLRLQVYGY